MSNGHQTGRRLRHQNGRGKVSLEPVPLDVGAARIGDDVNVVSVVGSDEAVESLDQVAPRLAVDPLCQVLKKLVQSLGRGKGKLVLIDGGNGDAASRERAQEVLQIHVGFLLDRGRYLARFPVELVDGDDAALAVTIHFTRTGRRRNELHRERRDA